VLITDHGNRLAFIGCNPAGPPTDWATSSTAGTADCGGANLDEFVAEVKNLVSQGYLTIVTIQYYESYDPTPLPIQYRDFQRLSDAGAVIVSGSQAHLPQAMELRNQGFIHYGLGNLFFDQMDTPWPDTKNEFIDRHVFYQGRYLGVELFTATLEDFVKPRPMTIQEREAELTKIFNVSGWFQSNGN
jgi:poly-gamma-glutamate capsule biosynthesis protein CapA/YwtB (metallophosphatase superfamily)